MPDVTMPVINRNADLNIYPEKVKHTATHVSIGDMHGNALKLIYCLIEDGILSLDEESYKKLRDIYKTPVHMLTKEQIETFKKLIDQATVNKDIALTLIGDELADRGNNDYFTLLVLKKLHTSGVHLDILLSNHSAEFIQDYDQMVFSGDTQLAKGQGQSLKNMQYLIAHGKITEEEVRKLVKENYAPAVKAINYTVTQDGDITLFTHAPVGLETVKALATYFKIKYQDNSVTSLILTIDAINTQVTLLFENKKLSSVIKNAFIQGPYRKEDVITICDAACSGQRVPIPTQAPLQRLVWNRYINHASEIETKPSGHFTVRFVHGHIGPQPFSLGSTALGTHGNLDSNFGKGENDSDAEHKVRHSNELTAFTPELLKELYFKKLDALMNELKKKTDELESKGTLGNPEYNPRYAAAAKAGKELFNSINDAKNKFTEQPNLKTLQAFINVCSEQTNKAAKSTLGEQRGIKKTVEAITTVLYRIFTALTFGAFLDKSQGFLKSTEVKLDTDTVAKTKNFKAELDTFKNKYEAEFLEQVNKPGN